MCHTQIFFQTLHGLGKRTHYQKQWIFPLGGYLPGVIGTHEGAMHVHMEKTKNGPSDTSKYLRNPRVELPRMLRTNDSSDSVPGPPVWSDRDTPDVRPGHAAKRSETVSTLERSGPFGNLSGSTAFSASKRGPTLVAPTSVSVLTGPEVRSENGSLAIDALRRPIAQTLRSQPDWSLKTLGDWFRSGPLTRGFGSGPY